MSKYIKITAIILVMVFIFTGCKTQETKDVEDLIDSIGVVSLDSYPSINDARKAYSKLSEKEQKRVSNYDVLTSAEARLDGCIDEHADKIRNEAQECFSDILNSNFYLAASHAQNVMEYLEEIPSGLSSNSAFRDFDSVEDWKVLYESSLDPSSMGVYSYAVIDKIVSNNIYYR